MEKELDTLVLNFDSESLGLVNIIIALIMFGVALDIRIDDFKKLLTSPKPAIIGIISQFFIVPLTTYILILVITPYPSIALGMIMVASCPGGNVSNFISKLAGGNAALSVSLTAFSTLLSVVMTPVNLSLWGGLYEPTALILENVHLDLFEILKIVSTIMGLPLILGMTLRHFKDKLSNRLSFYLKPFSIIIFIIFVIGALYGNWNIFLNYIHYVFFIVLLHNLILYVVGFYFGKVSGLEYKNQKTLSIETGIQNSGLGLMLVFTFFNGLGGMALLVAFWSIWDMFSGLLVAYYWIWKDKNTLKK